VQELSLPAPGAADAPLVDRRHTLVVHSGPGDEVLALTEYARELRPRDTLVVIAPRRPIRLPRDAVWQDVYPAAPHVPFAELVVTAGGFNAMLDCAPVRDRHRVIPFPRPLDDQFARARAAFEPKLAPWSRGSSKPPPGGPDAPRSSLPTAS
jgi:hypothetical protein